MDLKKAIMEPPPLKAKILMWAGATIQDMEEINKATSTEELEKVLSSVFQIDSTDPKQRVLLELYMNAVLFCRGMKFNKAQTSTLLSIFKRVHQANIDTALNNAEQCFNYCSELLLCHSVRRPPFSIGLYNLNQMTDILKYFTNTYMRHYALYKYIFTPQRFLDLTLTYSGTVGDHEPDELGSPGENKDEAEKGKDEENNEGREKDTDDKNKEQRTTEHCRQPVNNEQKDLITGPVLDKTGSAKKGELQSLVKQEVKQEMQRLTGHLEQCLKESTEQLNTILGSLQTNPQPKK
ncbi:coiled-coil domain-containing protein 189 isoform X2 [Clupea harengus]|uniref:Coiled-coil domain-containing protein 189 isoform X2 n=1 Tax=Clupea harengus TaxID=7950 RepID=A0A6P8EYV7_CLUHA|nr:coiled-coil domain-containing protein 189 isoform X2 [Clupea harengus]